MWIRDKIDWIRIRTLGKKILIRFHKIAVFLSLNAKSCWKKVELFEIFFIVTLVNIFRLVSIASDLKLMLNFLTKSEPGLDFSERRIPALFFKYRFRIRIPNNLVRFPNVQYCSQVLFYSTLRTCLSSVLFSISPRWVWKGK